MYFEDILKVAARFWCSPIDVNKIGVFYFENVDDTWKQLDDKYKYWVELLNWSIGVVLSETSRNIKNVEIKFVSISNINLIELEKRFNEIDLQGETWEKERKEYLGFRNFPKEFQLITNDYLANI